MLSGQTGMEAVPPAVPISTQTPLPLTFQSTLLLLAVPEAEAEDKDNIDQESPLKLMDNAFLISTQKQFDTHVSRIERRKAKPADEAETNEGLGDKVYEEEHD
jgi:hypothetical protein